MRADRFFTNKPALTSMIIAKTPQRVRELIDASVADGAEAIGIQTEHLNPEYQNNKVYRDLFSYTGSLPVYATHYRHDGKCDDELAKELLNLAECGADLCDVIGDLYDPQPQEVTENAEAIQKQEDLIEKLHTRGAKVLISSHIYQFTPAEAVLKIALEYQRRGADICKLVTGADTMEEQLENIKIINLLKKTLNIPVLFLCVGKCKILRRIGGEVGDCMYLCVHEHDALAAPAQPLIREVKAIREMFS